MAPGQECMVRVQACTCMCAKGPEFQLLNEVPLEISFTFSESLNTWNFRMPQSTPTFSNAIFKISKLFEKFIV